VNIPVDQVRSRIAEIEKLVGGDRERPIVLYCARGSRAAKALQILIDSGFQRVVNGGGLDDLQ
jgi:phage shock protein E